MSSLKQSFVEIKSIVTGQVELGPVKIAGWIRTRRGSKKFSFIELNDGTSANSIQVVADGNLSNYEDVIRKLTTGCAIAVNGELVKSQGEGQAYEVQASDVELLGDAKPEEYFIQKKRMTFEYLREHAHMRMRTALYSSVFRIRSKASQAIHRFF